MIKMSRVPIAPLEDTATFLENYWGRNQVFRTGQFGLAMISGLFQEKFPATVNKLLTASNAIATMRTTLRLLDDIPALVYTIKSLQTLQNLSWPSWTLELIGTLSSQLYYPMEHIAWAADLQLIPISSYQFWTMGTVLWSVSLLVSCLQNLFIIIRTTCKLGQIYGKNKNGSASNMYSSSDLLRGQRHVAILTLLQSLSDLMNAIHWLPNGVLWSGKLSLVWVGLFGSISSMIGLYKTFK